MTFDEDLVGHIRRQLAWTGIEEKPISDGLAFRPKGYVAVAVRKDSVLTRLRSGRGEVAGAAHHSVRERQPSDEGTGRIDRATVFIETLPAK